MDEQLRAVLGEGSDASGESLMRDLAQGSPPTLVKGDLERNSREAPRDLLNDRGWAHNRVRSHEFGRDLGLNEDPHLDREIGARGDRDRESNSVRCLDLARDLVVSEESSRDLRDASEIGGQDALAYPAGYRSGTYRGRGGGILSRSGVRSTAIGDSGGFSDLHRLLDRNHALEMELLRMQGKSSNPMDVSPLCDGAGDNLNYGKSGEPDDGMKSRSKEGIASTQPARGNATVEKLNVVRRTEGEILESTNPNEDGRTLAKDFMPPARGVGLEEYISAAISGSKATSKVGIPAGSRNARKPVETTAQIGVRADPFPPLSRSKTGDYASPSGDRDEDLGSSIGVKETAGLKPDKGEVNKFSWKDLVRSNKPDNVCVDLQYVEPTMIDGEACAVFSLEEEEENMKLWQNTLLCYVVGKSPSYYQFLKAMKRQWAPQGGMEMFSRENGIFYAKFDCEEDMNKVITEGPWYLDGKLVVVKKFSGATNCEEEMLSSIPIWVKLPSLPVQWWSILGVSRVVSPLGHPLYFDLPSAAQSRIAYARCCVEVAMEKSLPNQVRCVGGDKISRFQKIMYDWVPKRCTGCKEFGHLISDCAKMNGGGANTAVEARKQAPMMGSGWKSEKKMTKGKQTYVEIGKRLNEVDDQSASQTLKEGAEKGMAKLKNVSTFGAIYKTNILNNKIGKTIKAISENPFQVLEGLEEGDKRKNHSYLCSEDEEETEAANPGEEDQQRVSEDSGESDNMGEKEKTVATKSDPAIMDVDAIDDECIAAEHDSREQDAKGLGEVERPPAILRNDTEEEMGSEGSDSDKQDSDAECEEEGQIQNYGKIPAELGMPPSLTVTNPKYKGEPEIPVENKKQKKRSVPAPERPEGSRTTRHSAGGKSGIRKGFLM